MRLNKFGKEKLTKRGNEVQDEPPDFDIGLEVEFKAFANVVKERYDIGKKAGLTGMDLHIWVYEGGVTPSDSGKELL